MKYLEAMDFIEECNMAGIVPGLDSIRELCRRIGNPQDKLKFIHIAGTNGKGSTLAYMSTILKCAGYRTGRYISPTIVSYLERFQVDEKQISQRLFSQLADTVKSACDEMTAEGLPHPTAFEVETAIAFLFFLEKKCDIVVLECGMGGREDATNLITTTIMEVLAHIDMDHMQFLGDNLTRIAYQKAGIIKPHSAVVSGLQYDEVSDVIKSVSEENEAHYSILKRDDITKIKYSIKGQSFEYSGNKYTTPLLGTHQVDNAALAVLAMQTLDSMIAGGNKLCDGLVKRIDPIVIQKGISETKWQARLQIISKKPLFIIDGAHNPDAAGRLKESLEMYFADKRKIFIMGMFRDKAVEEVVDIMCPMADVIFTIATPGSARALPAVELAGIIKDRPGITNNVTSLDSVEEAVEMSKLVSDSNSVIVAFGSLAFLGRIILQNK